ncbi:MAG: NfeD family protein [Clostridia bacterium]|nr:NfeD family protein [Clostridia bacterium]
MELYIGLWAAVLVLMLILEASTAALVSVWFAVGAFCALISAFFGAVFGVQISVFLVVSGLMLAFLLPYTRRKMAARKTATNADRIIGAEAVVTEEIDEIAGTGQIRVMGAVWSAKSKSGARIPVGEKVKVEEISGVKAVVVRTA